MRLPDRPLHAVAVRSASLVSDESALDACTRNALYKLTTFTFTFIELAAKRTKVPFRNCAAGHITVQQIFWCQIKHRVIKQLSVQRPPPTTARVLHIFYKKRYVFCFVEHA